MSKLDPNKLMMVLAVITLVVIAAMSGYRLQIGPSGLTFEHSGDADAAANSKLIAPPPSH
jgi:hypothetical protein